MKLVEIYELITQNTPAILIIVLVLMTLIQITPIKIDPWSTLLKFLGKAFNANISEQVVELDKNLNKRIDEMDKANTERDIIFGQRIDVIEEKLDNHIQESDERDVRLRRESILDFASAVANGRNYTKEQYEQMLKECDDYELYCERKQIKNSVAMASIAIIQKTFEEHLLNNDFLSTRFSAMIAANLALAEDDNDDDLGSHE